jgi:F-type H+-transporting ATPase subunit beta
MTYVMRDHKTSAVTEAAPKSDAPNLGVVASVRGSVVDIRFDGHLPPIYALLHAQAGEIVIEVLAQLDAHHVRGIALTPTQGLARGMAVEDSGGPLKAPVGRGILSRMFDVFGNVIDREAALTDVQLRQSGIDAELFDVISGVEALSEARTPRSP